MLPILKTDLHIHSQFSDGKLSIREIVDLNAKKGINIIAITDHLCEQNNFVGRVTNRLNYSLTPKNFDEYIETIKKEAKRAWDKYNMLVIPGYEISKNSFINQRSAHLLVLGVEEYISPDLGIDDILDEAKRKNGFTIAAHPFHTGDFEFQTFHLWSRRQELKSKIDAWEFNYRTRIFKDVLNSGLPLIANSDFHHMKHFASWKTNLHCDLDQNAVFEAIKNQKLDFYLDESVDIDPVTHAPNRFNVVSPLLKLLS